jgi:hypothetical protein
LGELGSFSRQNGYTGEFGKDWEHITGNQCSWSGKIFTSEHSIYSEPDTKADCGKGCPFTKSSAKAQQYCGIEKKTGNMLTQELCCPFTAIPDPDTCHWTSGMYFILQENKL